jgi:signal transduction histidine kinase
MFRFKAIWPILFGDPDKISSEKYFVALTSLVAAVFLLLLCIVHIFMGLGIAPVILAGSSSLVMLVLYLFLRFGNCLFIPKLILTVVGLIILDFTWYSKYLSNGPVLFFILIFAALIIWVWEGKALITILIFYFLNLAVLGIIDRTAPEYLFVYDVPSRRGLDIYLSFFLYSSLMIFLLYKVKKEFTRQKEKAMKSDMLKSAFLANLSHEIRTPMNAIVGFGQLLNDGVGSTNKQQYIKTIQNSSNTLLRLINDIIDLSKIEAGDLVVEYSKISVRAMFNELKDVFSIEIATRERSDVEISFSISEDDIIIESDELRLKQILSNLLSNAIKFTQRGTVNYSCEKRGKELVFCVSDTGTGIPEEDQPRIFERFTKFNYKGLNTEGTGIGLSITEKLVFLLGGRIWFSSIPGKGSDFFFSIPYTVL